jgi:predicted small secreted protein
MKRFAYVAIAAAALAFGVGACKKAHNAGNDSMDAGHSSISATATSSVTTSGTSH